MLILIIISGCARLYKSYSIKTFSFLILYLHQHRFGEFFSVDYFDGNLLASDAVNPELHQTYINIADMHKTVHQRQMLWKEQKRQTI